jgi:hypothetical protein
MSAPAPVGLSHGAKRNGIWAQRQQSQPTPLASLSCSSSFSWLLLEFAIFDNEDDLVAALPTAASGKYEQFKTTVHFDATARNPQWLG